MAFVKTVDFHQTEVASRKICQCALFKSMAMQQPIASRSNQTVKRHNLQDFVPARALPTCGKFLPPKKIKTQPPPQFATQPVRAPLPWTRQPHTREPDRHNGSFLLNRNRLKMVFFKESDLCGAAGIPAEKFDCLEPCRFLTVLEFSKVKNLPLQHPPARDAPVFHNTRWRCSLPSFRRFLQRRNMPHQTTVFKTATRG